MRLQEKCNLNNMKRISKTNFDKHRGIIFKIAKKYADQTSCSFDDLVAEGHLAYVLAKKRYEPKLGKFSTFLYTYIDGIMKQYVKAEKRNNNPSVIEEITVSNNPDTLDNLLFSEKLSSVSKEAQEMIQTVLNTPFELIELCRNTDTNKTTCTISKYYIRKYFTIYKNWKHDTINSVFKELGKIF